MAHDGQELGGMTPVLLDDLLALTGAAVAPVEEITELARTYGVTVRLWRSGGMLARPVTLLEQRNARGTVRRDG